MVPFSFQGQELAFAPGPAGRGTALYWPAEQALLVADLHLEKASFLARHGQMLPPYDSRETLERVAEAVRYTGARRVFALGDNFHDRAGPDRLDPHAAGMLSALTRALDWVWIVGNHDPAVDPRVGGTWVSEMETAGIALRHEARADTRVPELSGHFHPCLALWVRGRRIRRPCAVRSEQRLILPAFGALTGGLDASDRSIIAALQPARRIDALVPGRGRALEYPLWRAAA